VTHPDPLLQMPMSAAEILYKALLQRLKNEGVIEAFRSQRGDEEDGDEEDGDEKDGTLGWRLILKEGELTFSFPVKGKLVEVNLKQEVSIDKKGALQLLVLLAGIKDPAGEQLWQEIIYENGKVQDCDDKDFDEKDSKKRALCCNVHFQLPCKDFSFWIETSKGELCVGDVGDFGDGGRYISLWAHENKKRFEFKGEDLSMLITDPKGKDYTFTLAVEDEKLLVVAQTGQEILYFDLAREDFTLSQDGEDFPAVSVETASLKINGKFELTVMGEKIKLEGPLRKRKKSTLKGMFDVFNGNWCDYHIEYFESGRFLVFAKCLEDRTVYYAPLEPPRERQEEKKEPPSKKRKRSKKRMETRNTKASS